jgi:hypothetical protein
MPIYAHPSTGSMMVLKVPADGTPPTIVPFENTPVLLQHYREVCQRPMWSPLGSTLGPPWEQVATGYPEPCCTGVHPDEDKFYIRQRERYGAERVHPANWEMTTFIGVEAQMPSRVPVLPWVGQWRAGPWVAPPPGTVPEHSRYPGVYGDLYVACSVVNCVTRDRVALSIQEADVGPLIEDELWHGWLGEYAPCVEGFLADMRLLIGYVVDRGIAQSSQITDHYRELQKADGPLTPLLVNWRYPPQAVPSTPERAARAYAEMNAWVTQLELEARARSDRMATELVALCERPPGPSRSALKKQRLRRAKAAAKAAAKEAASAKQPRKQRPAPEPSVAICAEASPAVADECARQLGDLVIQDALARPIVDEPDDCVVCEAGPKNTALLPCGHMCACPDCAPRLQCCPICRAHVTQAVRIYIS